MRKHVKTRRGGVITGHNHLITFLVILFVTTLTGCAPLQTSFQELPQIHYQKPHRTEFVLVTHSPVKYYWELGKPGPFVGNVQIEVQRDSLPAVWEIWYELSQRAELDLVEPYLANCQDPAPVTQEVYFQTMQRALTKHTFLQLSPYSGTVVVNNFMQKKSDGQFLPYNILFEGDVDPPEWYLVLEVDDLGLMRLGIGATSGDLAFSLGVALATAFESAVTGKRVSSWFSGRIMVADANSYKILWKSEVKEKVEIDGNLEELVEAKRDAFPSALVEAIARAAAKNAASLIKNQYVDELDETTAKYQLKREEIEPFIDRICLRK